MELKPRIYTYKVTFEEIPHWYWGVHKEDAHNDGYLGSPNTHKWVWEFYTPSLQICEIFPYTDKGWENAQDVENRCISPDLNNPLCLNEHCGGNISIKRRREGGLTAVEQNKKLKRGLHGLTTAQLSENGKNGSSKGHRKKNECGKSEHAVEMNKKSNEKKNEEGKSINAVSRGEAASKIKYVDPDHPELGTHRACTLALMQKKRGYPRGSKNRVKVTSKGAET